MDRPHLKICLALMALIGALIGMAAIESFPAQAPTPPVLGNRAIAMLENQDGKFFCTAVYVRAGGDTLEAGSGLAWVATAAHCANAVARPRIRGRQYVMGSVTWRALVLSREDLTVDGLDVAIGTLPDARDTEKRQYYTLALRNPEPGQAVLIHGFPHGTERLLHAVITAAEGLGIRLRVRDGIIESGFSGAAVLTEAGEVMGILWGVSADDPTDGVMTPVNVLRLLFTTLQVRN